MRTQPILAAFALAAASLLTGCITAGKAKEAHLVIGWPSVLAFEKNVTGVSYAPSGELKAATANTKFTLLLLTWDSGQKDLELDFKRPAPAATTP